jgi:inosine/xanthosine triphosphate pyrophosphatase family protein
MKICTFVTGNPNKVIEVNAIIGTSIPIQPVALDNPEIQGTLEEIARDKCRRATQMVRSERANSLAVRRLIDMASLGQWTGYCGRFGIGI